MQIIAPLYLCCTHPSRCLEAGSINGSRKSRNPVVVSQELSESCKQAFELETLFSNTKYTKRHDEQLDVNLSLAFNSPFAPIHQAHPPFLKKRGEPDTP